MIEESYTADLSALQHLPEHDGHHDAFDPTCATTGVNPNPGGDDPFDMHFPGSGQDGHDGPDHDVDGGHEEHEHDAAYRLSAGEPLPEPEPYGVGH